MRALDLFSGIGGFALGCESAGIKTAAFCEIDEAARKVLAIRFPGIPIFEDVTRLEGSHVGPVDVICGGFPCQDISAAGKGAGIHGERSGLFFEIIRLAAEIRPRWLLLENVSAILNRGMGDALASLNQIGHDAQWHCLPASAIGAPHRRDRVFIIAADTARLAERKSADKTNPKQNCRPTRDEFGNSGDAVPHTDSPRSFSRAQARVHRVQDETRARDAEPERFCGAPGAIRDANGAGLAFWETFAKHCEQELKAAQRAHLEGVGRWSIEPNLGRVVNGLPRGLDGLSKGEAKRVRGLARDLSAKRQEALKQLGNAVVPGCVEIFAKAIVAMDSELGVKP